jgi:hypothetical protein
MSAFAGRFPEWFQTTGLWIGIIAASLGAVLIFWHWINTWRAHHQRAVFSNSHLNAFIIGVVVLGAVWISVEIADYLGSKETRYITNGRLVSTQPTADNKSELLEFRGDVAGNQYDIKIFI